MKIAGLRELLKLALAEDLGEAGDITSLALIPPDQTARAYLLIKQDCVYCAATVLEDLFAELLEPCTVLKTTPDGSLLKAGERPLVFEARLQAILSAERTLLNFIQRLSGVATLSRRYVDKLSSTKTRLLDTRKTMPAYRDLDKYAVKIGGGENHRRGLYDQVLIKNNHLDALHCDITLAIKKARQATASKVLLEIEVRNLDELRSAARNKPDIIMLDNFPPSALAEAIRELRLIDPEHRIKTEVSGGITLENIIEYAVDGVDYISVGAITHSAPAVDISLRIENLN